MKTDTRIFHELTEGSITHDGWMHVCPIGEFPWESDDGEEKVMQVIDEEALRLMAASYPLSVGDSLIDREHLSIQPKGDTASMGWGKEAEMREDGLWVRVEWTPTGRQLVEGKEYKFCSGCFLRPGLVHLGGDRYRVTQLGRIALTNNPNLPGQKPLTNSRTGAANPQPTPKRMDYKTLVLKLLGLAADASDEQIATAAEALKQNPTQLANRIKELEGILANSDLDAHGITDKSQRDMLAPLLANSTSRPAALALMKGGKPADTKPPLHNRKDAKVPGTDKQLSNADEDKAANNLHNRAMAYKHQHKVPYETAMAAVRQMPEATA